MYKIIILGIIISSFLFSAPAYSNQACLKDNKKQVLKKIAAKPTFYHINGVRKWYLIGNSLTPGNNIIHFRVDTDADVQSLEVFIDNQFTGKLSKATAEFVGNIDITSLIPGKHSLQLIADGNATFIAKCFFYRSHPIYVLLTTDWDTSDSKNSVLKRHEQLHYEHPALKITHFFAPYTFTDPALSEPRRIYLANWIIRLRDSYQDEIGLHIHPYCNFVNTVAGVDCHFKPSDTFQIGDSSGYTVLSSSYSETDYLRLLKAADALFIAHGLGKPTSFRTGSWAAGAHTLKALAADGFVADSSANNWLRIKEESKNDGNGLLYKWNRQHWRTINDLSQPYYPSEHNPSTTGIPSINILEVPDNGSLVDYVTADEMIRIFKSNWPGRALSRPGTYVFGFHPVSYNQAFHERIEKTLNYIDHFLAENDQGPVVYETLSHMAGLFSSASR